MLTVITGTPGAGKSLYTVWEIARGVPGSTVENNGVSVPRRLLSNIKGLLVEHEHITAENLENWHEWAKPGDVIIFDEVQEVWRPRGLGTKVPDAIAKLETHRHMGVDLVLVTQHPMLVDPNIRRLVNRHIHLRRISKGCAMLYEWDHCSNPGMLKTSLSHRLWWHKKEGYKLYTSAQLHTKPTTRVPALAFVGLLALGALIAGGPTVYARMFNVKETMAGKPAAPRVIARPIEQAQGPARAASAAGLAAAPQFPPVLARAEVRPQGCIAFKDRCECFDQSGARMAVEPAQCLEGSHRTGYTVPGALTAVPAAWRAAAVPPGSDASAPASLANKTAGASLPKS